MTSTAHLTAESLTIRVPGRLLVEALELSIRPGELVAILGQNGSGKSLCMMTLAGLRAPDSGHVSLGDVPLTRIHRSALAKRLSLLPQVVEDLFPSTVLETALIGRYPHIGRFSWESEQDRAMASASLEAMDLGAFAGRDVLTLSGGERQRLAIAQILTQQPGVYLLDEPTNHLDPQHQVDVMRVFRNRADAGDAGYSDRCLLLFGDGRWRLGNRDDVLDEETLTELYGTPMERVRWRDGSLFVAAAS